MACFGCGDKAALWFWRAECVGVRQRFPAGFAEPNTSASDSNFAIFLGDDCHLFTAYLLPFDCRLTAYFTPLFPHPLPRQIIGRFVAFCRSGLFCARLLAELWLVVCDITYHPIGIISPVCSLTTCRDLFLVPSTSFCAAKNCCLYLAGLSFPVRARESARQSSPVFRVLLGIMGFCIQCIQFLRLLHRQTTLRDLLPFSLLSIPAIDSCRYAAPLRYQSLRLCCNAASCAMPAAVDKPGSSRLRLLSALSTRKKRISSSRRRSVSVMSFP